MSEKKDAILLVNYGFPPYPGVGGRRWAIFAQRLALAGYSVQVLAKDYQGDNPSLYSSYVQGQPEIQVHSLPGFYPKILNQTPENLLQKIQYKIWDKAMRLFSKGTPYDKSVWGEKKIKKLARDLIRKHKIKNVIVSGAPFRLNYYFSELKNELDFNLLNDLRDPWTWGIGYGYSTLPPGKMAFEKQMEATVLEKSDAIFVPVQVMEDHLKNSYPKAAGRIHLLPHGFDGNSIPRHPLRKPEPDKPIRLIFIGNLYDGIGPYMKNIARGMAQAKGKIELDIFSGSQNYADFFREAGILYKSVRYHKPVPPEKLFQDIKNYHFALLVHPDYGIHNISTKFYEILYSNTPLLYTGNPGKTSDWVTQHKVGIYIPPEKLESQLSSPDFCIDFNFDPQIDISGYAFDRLTQQLITYFK